MTKHILIAAAVTIITLSALAQKVSIGTIPEDAELHLNSEKVRNPKNVNISDPNIGLIAYLPGYGTQGLKPLDLRGEKISEYNIELKKLVKPKTGYTSAKIEFTKLLDRSGKVEKRSVPTGWYGTMTEGTDLEDARFTEAITKMISKWGYRTAGTSTMFKEDKKTPDFGIGGELTWFAKGTAGSGFQISLFIKWSVYSRDKEAVVYEKTVGAYSNSGSTSKFNDELVFTLEDGIKALLGDPDFTALVASDASDDDVDSDYESILISKVDKRSTLEYGEIIKKSMLSTITVKTNFGHGSGFIISEDGYILTNDHVVRNASKIEVIFDQGFSFKAEIVRSDRARDVALLKIPGSGFKPLPLSADVNSSDVGTDVVVIGTPKTIELGQTVTKGIISGQRELDEKAFLQTDVAINAGNSGGPLINTKTGEVVGMVVAKVKETGVEGLGFAIPIDDCRKILNIKID